MKMPRKEPGDRCGCCKEGRLKLVNGALVCERCDCVDLWPSQKDA